MKQFLIFLFVFPSPALYSQVRIYNSNLTDTSSFVLYEWSENYIVIEPGRVSGKITLQATRSQVASSGSNEFRLRPYSTGTDTIKIYIDNKLAATKLFISQTLPDVVAGIGHNADTVLTVGQVLANPFLKTVYRGPLYKSNIVITSFEMSGITKDGDEFLEYAPGNIFTHVQIEILKNLSPGGKILFTGIRAMGPDSRPRLLKPFTLTIR